MSKPMRQRRAQPIRRVGAALCAAMTVFGATSCSLFDAEPPLVIGVTTESPASGMTDAHARDLAAYYGYWLSERKMRERDEARAVEEVPVRAEDRWEAVRSGQVDLVFGCTGELLDSLDAHKAQLLRKLYAEQENPDPTEWRDISNTTLLSTLPAELAASIPGEAHGCADDSLPQNLIAVYAKGLMSREQRVAVNNATAGMDFDRSMTSLLNS
ncbi:hypothetical protein F7230_02340 [Corynebacterium sp. 320]|uniref:hypothetical protein n=1 Tax=Corynebacterium TaxID=1716 RepID=UPI00125CACD6|nr:MULTISPECIES: hypothetical protein [Corynebacterium]KAB1503965.1 hypothetical protein F7230_02340 [Corynebacterium sp. 320]KAB1552936.1 hypothetical protein F7233_04255 [Corynebacterium sp. 321]KAB1553844.1 hypothetical protein F7232_02325 [Corynebacterium sp. 319]KAB3528101.1 hypothetical protein F8354_02340 [Corynebacterium sp. 250]KAB3540411.1 hypothetical protein F8390_04000 [Corynebacterium sp. 366]